jgi:hypothetical protein
MILQSPWPYVTSYLLCMLSLSFNQFSLKWTRLFPTRLRAIHHATRKKTRELSSPWQTSHPILPGSNTHIINLIHIVIRCKHSDSLGLLFWYARYPGFKLAVTASSARSDRLHPVQKWKCRERLTHWDYPLSWWGDSTWVADYYWAVIQFSWGYGGTTSLLKSTWDHVNWRHEQ